MRGDEELRLAWKRALAEPADLGLFWTWLLAQGRRVPLHQVLTEVRVEVSRYPHGSLDYIVVRNHRWPRRGASRPGDQGTWWGFACVTKRTPVEQPDMGPGLVRFEEKLALVPSTDDGRTLWTESRPVANVLELFEDDHACLTFLSERLLRWKAPERRSEPRRARARARAGERAARREQA